eukprot:scaffold51657_cov39-Phaeocystis_antarctica.AAC.2
MVSPTESSRGAAWLGLGLGLGFRLRVGVRVRVSLVRVRASRGAAFCGSAAKVRATETRRT